MAKLVSKAKAKKPSATKSGEFRSEKDTLGAVKVPAGALYGAQTQRAVENYPVSGLREHPVFIRSFIQLKKAAALANFELDAMDESSARAISDACDEILGDLSLPFSKVALGVASSAQEKGRGVSSSKVAISEGDDDDLRSVPYKIPSFYVADDYRRHFVVDVFQAGAGTSFNMNCNEVIANLANRKLGGELGIYSPIHPNDHVNMAQSTNDVFPTAIRLATLTLLRELFPALDSLSFALDGKGEEFADVIKSGRTHLQDAVPVTLGQEFKAYAAAIRRATKLLLDAADELRELGIGGTAAGTGINTPIGYRFAVVKYLERMTSLDLEAIDDLRESMQSQLPIAAVSSALKNLALEMTRITNDLRLMASGPITGLAEILLPSVQPGSSIMPGKVNPSMLECMNQICFHVIGCDTTISYCLQAGQLELNVMMPLMGYEILFSIDILKNFLPVFVQKCVSGIAADRARCESYYATSPSLATALNPLIGYEKAAEIAKESARTRKPIVQILRERKILTEKQIGEIFTPEFLAGQADRQPE